MQTFSQRFIIRKSKSNRQPNSSIYARINVNGSRVEISANRHCEPDKWDHAKGRLIGRTEQARELNDYLNTVELRVYELHKEQIAAKATITGKSFKSAFLGEDEKPRMLIEIFEHHNDQFKALVGKDYAVNTYKKYYTCLNSLKSFLNWKFKKSDIAIETIGNQFINDFEFYLKTERNIQHNGVMGDIKKLKKVVRQCVANGWLDRDPFMNFKIRMKETTREILHEHELNKMEEKIILTDRLSIVRDIFLFSCYTGLSYSDMVKLTEKDLTIGIDGKKWICTSRTKTGTDSRIPLLPIANSLILKYKDHPKAIVTGRLFPVLTNQKMNSYLKELADICQINKELTFHCARHTFATTVTLSNGVPIETVSKMLGHRTLRTTQVYAKVLDKKVSDDMRVLMNKFGENRPTNKEIMEI